MEAYQYLVENEFAGGGDHDRSEEVAAQLRDTILSVADSAG